MEELVGPDWEKWEKAVETGLISRRTYNVIHRTYRMYKRYSQPIEELSVISDEKLLKIRKLGPKGLQEIREVFPIADNSLGKYKIVFWVEGVRAPDHKTAKRKAEIIANLLRSPGPIGFQKVKIEDVIETGS